MASQAIYDERLEFGRPSHRAPTKLEMSLIAGLMWFGVCVVLWRWLSGLSEFVIDVPAGLVLIALSLSATWYVLNYGELRIDFDGILVPRGGRFFRATYVRFGEVEVALLGSPNPYAKRVGLEAIVFLRRGWTERDSYRRRHRDVIAILELNAVKNPTRLVKLLAARVPVISVNNGATRTS